MSYSGPLVQPQAKVRPGKGWIWLGVLLMIASFVTFITMFGFAVADLAAMSFDPTEVEVSSSVRMTLDPGEYRIYSADFGEPVVTVTGDDGRVELSAATTDTADHQFRTWRSSTKFTINTTGSYLISNDGRTRAGIAPDIDTSREASPLFAGSFASGAALGIPGFIVLVVTAIARRRSRKRLQEATGTYSGVPYNTTPGQYGGPPPGAFGPPGSYGAPPPGSYGQAPPGNRPQN